MADAIKELTSQIIITPDKSNFVFHQNNNHPFIITSTFDINNGALMPTIKVPINRINVAQNLLKLLPGGVILNSNGTEITIDSVSKMIKFDDLTLKGIIQFQLANRNELAIGKIISIYKEIQNNRIEYITIEDDPEEPEFIPEKLHISGIMLDRGTLVCVTDAVEKILLLPVRDTSTGLIGSIKKQDIKLFNLYKKIWPELKFKVERQVNKYYIYSKIVKFDITNIGKESYIKVHRNFGGSDLQIEVTHELLDEYVNSCIDYQIACE